MKKILLIIFYSTFYFFTSFAQNPVAGSFSPSAGSTSLGKSGDTPVNLYTGTPQMQIPLFNFKSANLSNPISLSYHASGIRVGEIASWVGLGWSLNAGGVITREINGKPDDINEGYLFNNDRPNELKVEAIIANASNIASGANPQTPLYEGLDTEPDIFYFNVNGLSGRFIFDKYGEVRLLSDQDLIIDLTHSDTYTIDDDHPDFDFTSKNTGGILSFTIIGPDGTQYVFDQREVQYSKNKQVVNADLTQCPNPMQTVDYCDFTSVDGYISSWYLSKIYNYHGQKEIEISYDNEVYFDNSNISQSFDEEIRYDENGNYEPLSMFCYDENGSGNFPEPPTPSYVINWGLNIPDFVTTTYIQSKMVFTKRIKEINASISNIDFGSLEFTTNAPGIRADLVIPLCLYFNNQQEFDSDDYHPPSHLSKIIWKGRDGTKIKEIDFNLGYYAEESNTCLSGQIGYSTRKRLKLQGLTESEWGDDGIKTSLPPYEFEYDSPNSTLPPRWSPQQDYWGFYNANGATTHIPNFYMYPDDEVGAETYNSKYSIFQRTNYTGLEVFVDHGADRNPNENAMKIGILNKIKYPIGGITEFEYEAHRFLFEGQTIFGGGLRVSQIRQKASENSTPIIKNFIYENDNEESTGRIIEIPSFGRLKSCFAVCELGNLQVPLYYQQHPTPIWKRLTAVYSTPQNGLGLSQGGHIGYGSVIEDFNGNGKIKYEFKFDFYAGNTSGLCSQHSLPYVVSNAEYYGCNSYENFPFPPNPNQDSNQGYLLNKTIYNSSNDIRLEETYTYTPCNNDYIQGLKKHIIARHVEEDPNGGGLIFSDYSMLLGIYDLISGDKKLSSILTKTYAEDGNYVENRISYEYGSSNHMFPTKTTILNSGGSRSTEFIYPQEMQGNGIDGAENAALDALVSQNRINTPIKVIQRNGGVIIGETHTVYNGSLAGTLNFYVPHLIRKKEKNTAWRIIATYGSPTFLGNADGYTPEGFTDKVNYGFSPDGLLTSKNYKGREWIYDYNSAGILNYMKDPNGQVVEYEYDGFSRKVKETSRNGQVETTFTYLIDGQGNNSVTTYTDYGDQYTNQTETNETVEYFDGFGRFSSTVAKSHSPSGGDVTLRSVVYDNFGRQEKVFNLGSGTIRMWYFNSPLNRLKRSLDASGLVSTNYITNPDQSLIGVEVTDKDHRKTSTFKDGFGRVILVINAEDGETWYGYDPDHGGLKAILPPGVSSSTSPLAYKYEYDDRYRLKEKFIPGMTGSVSYRYNDKNQLTLQQDPNLRAQSDYNWSKTNYDDFGRPTRSGLIYSGGEPNPEDISISKILTTTEYDEPTGGATIGKITSRQVAILGSGGTMLSTNITYDDFGQAIQVSKTNHLNGIDITNISFDNVGKTKSTTFHHTSGTDNIKIIQQNAYDNGGRLRNVSHKIGSPSEIDQLPFVQISNHTYNSLNQVIEKNLGVFTTAVNNGPLQSYNTTSLQSLDYSYDGLGRLTNINELDRSPNLTPLGTCVNIPTSDCNRGNDKFCDDRDFVADDIINIRRTSQRERIRLDCYTDSTLGIITPTPGFDDEVGLQKQSIETITENASINEIVFPTTLNRVLLYEEREIYLFEQELGEIEGEYETLQVLALAGPGEIVPGIIDPEENELFAMEINYGAIDINSIQWQTKGKTIKEYSFNYDEMHRLNNANYKEYFYDGLGECSFTNQGRYSVWGIDYDLRGNIQNLSRNGAMGTCNPNNYNYGKIDELTYSYSGNQLQSVLDEASFDYGFKTQPSFGGNYSYDASGNLTSNPDKGITNIKYNVLNLIEQVDINGGNTIEWTYDADGNKLKMDAGDEIRDYVGGIEYKNNELAFVSHSEGRALKTIDGYQYEYVITDHLGNARITFKEGNEGGFAIAEIVQENHYYPFGLKMEGSFTPDSPQSQINKYQYNGIEYIDNFDLDVNFATFRTLDPALGRWWQIDPYAESFHSLTPYNSMANNPVRYNDPDGDWVNIVIGGFIGGAVNVYTHWGQIDGLGDGFAAFGIGAAGGAITAATGGLAAGAGLAGGGLIGGVSGMTGDFVTQVGNMAYFGDEYNAQQNLFAGLSGGVFGAADGVLMQKAGSALIPGTPRFPDGISALDLMEQFENFVVLNLKTDLWKGKWQFAVSELGNGTWHYANTIEGARGLILKANGKLPGGSTGNVLRTIQWSSSRLKKIGDQIASGNIPKGGIKVNSKAEAEEIFMNVFHGKGYKNTTGMTTLDMKDKFLYPNGKAGTYHWDLHDTMHGGVPHLQIHPHQGKGIIRIFF